MQADLPFSVVRFTVFQFESFAIRRLLMLCRVVIEICAQIIVRLLVCVIIVSRRAVCALTWSRNFTAFFFNRLLQRSTL